jgi:hypothetical protein
MDVRNSDVPASSEQVRVTGRRSSTYVRKRETLIVRRSLRWIPSSNALDLV